MHGEPISLGRWDLSSQLLERRLLEVRWYNCPHLQVGNNFAGLNDTSFSARAFNIALNSSAQQALFNTPASPLPPLPSSGMKDCLRESRLLNTTPPPSPERLQGGITLLIPSDAAFVNFTVRSVFAGSQAFLAQYCQELCVTAPA